MKKIIAAFDGLKFSTATKDYAITIAKQTNTHLVGIFLDDFTYNSYKLYELAVKEKVSEKELKLYEEKDKATRLNAAEDFEKACQHAALEYSIHHDRSIAIHELLHECIYTDLLIIDANETLSHYTEKLPARFVRDLLGEVPCPVIVVPHAFNPLQKIILLYDGEPSSVHAAKMFSYLLPQLKHLDTEVVSVNPADGSLHLADNKLMKELMKRHFPNATYTILKGDAEEEIVKYLKQQTVHALVVLGAYQRSMVSRWFRQSMADVLMKEVKLPLFIAHQK